MRCRNRCRTWGYLGASCTSPRLPVEWLGAAVGCIHQVARDGYPIRVRVHPRRRISAPTVMHRCTGSGAELGTAQLAMSRRPCSCYSRYCSLGCSMWGSYHPARAVPQSANKDLPTLPINLGFLLVDSSSARISLDGGGRTFSRPACAIHSQPMALPAAARTEHDPSARRGICAPSQGARALRLSRHSGADVRLRLASHTFLEESSVHVYGQAFLDSLLNGAREGAVVAHWPPEWKVATASPVLIDHQPFEFLHCSHLRKQSARLLMAVDLTRLPPNPTSDTD